MRPVATDWTIVLAGNWNLAILNPRWVGRELFEVDPIAVEVIIADNGQTQLRYTHENVTLVPTVTQVVVSASDASDEALGRAEAIALRLLEFLPRTPLQALGINFGYVEANVEPQIAAIFNVRDTQQFAGLDLAINSTEILRRLEYDNRQLNFKLAMAGNELRSHFNFHTPVAAGPASIDALRGKPVAYRLFSERVLREIYNLEREGPNGP